MSREFPIDVTASGAVLLGRVISCDGFHHPHPVRVQTHVHTDHMREFETSKGNQAIVLSAATLALLVGEFNADLPYRINLIALDPPGALRLDDTTVELVSSGHMVGAVQVAVETPEGVRLGYSGDFGWPLEHPIQVDALVVDSTYGSPSSVRYYTQDAAEECLVDLVSSRLRAGPVHIFASRGTLHRALQLLSGQFACPMIASHRVQREAAAFRRYGYAIDDLSLRCDDRIFVAFYGRGDAKPVDPIGTTIALSAYMADPRDPILEYSERAFRVAMSNHADFNGTLEYIEATGASYVVTDNTRGKGVELAAAIRERLGVEARASLHSTTSRWGG